MFKNGIKPIKIKKNYFIIVLLKFCIALVHDQQ